VIKLDIINEVVARTGITKTKAELAVETVDSSRQGGAFQAGEGIAVD
jgi:hypothetical protein